MCFYCTGCGFCARAKLGASGLPDACVYCLDCGASLQPDDEMSGRCGSPAPTPPGKSRRLADAIDRHRDADKRSEADEERLEGI